MDARRLAEENLREAACIGDEDAVRAMLMNGVDINSQNKVNGWSALHWAVHRGHKRLVKALIDWGADVDLKNADGNAACSLAKDPEIQQMLGVTETSTEAGVEDLATFEPNYLRSPQLVYVDRMSSRPADTTTHTATKVLPVVEKAQSNPMPAAVAQHSLTVKVRVAGDSETDFVEVDVDDLTFSGLLKACANELDLRQEDIVKVRKLPNVLVRKDRDVQRLTVGTELEVCLSHS